MDKNKFLKFKDTMALLIVPLCFGLYSFILGQDKNWDLLNYHLYNPFSFFRGRLCYDLAPAGLQTYFNPFLDIPYFLAISYWNPKAVSFVLGVIHGFNFIILFYLCKRILKSLNMSKELALFLALAGVLSIGFLSEVGTTFHDNISALFCLLSALIIVLSMDSICNDEKKAVWSIMLAGVVIGVGSGFKPVTIIYALALCFSLFTVPILLSHRLKYSIIFGVAVLFGLSLAGGYWMYNIWREFGNPLFPQFNHIFSGDLAQPSAMRDLRFLPKSFFEKIIYPLIFTIYPQRVAELPYKQVSWLILYVTVIIFLLNRLIKFFLRSPSCRSLSPEANFLISYLCLGYLLWLNIFGIYRYLIPIELILPLILLIIVNTFIKSKWSIVGSLIIIVLMTIINVKNVTDWGHAPWDSQVFHVGPQDMQKPETSVVFLAGQPLAWLAPALNINARFIQLMPNFSVSDAYWRRAQSFISGLDYYVILGRENPSVIDQANERLRKLGLFFNRNTCKTMDAYIGATVIQYKYCKVQKE